MSKPPRPQISPVDTDQYADTDRPYDIYARVFQFSVRVIRFVRTFPRSLDAVEVGRQLVRSGPSVGANMEEADAAESRADFVHNVRVSCKEARESRFWLRVCLSAEIGNADEARSLLQESDELVRILSRIHRNAQANGKRTDG